MIWVKLKRIIKSGFISFWRNGYVSLASTLVMTVTLSVILAIIFVGALLNSTLQGIREKVDINVYFIKGATEEQIFSLQREVEALPEVESVVYTSAEQALENFRLKHKDNPLIIGALEEINTNPLGASLNIRARDPSQYESIASFVQTRDLSGTGAQSIVEKINYTQNKVAIEALGKLIQSSEQLGAIIALFFALISILITFNTIRLAIFISKDEISVMRLVGASQRYIRGPFLIVGVLYGLIAAIITIVIAFPITYWVGPMTISLGTGLNAYTYYLDNFIDIAGAVILIGLFLGIVSSYLATKKYLKRI
jgi:cell division transport system permease protein